MTTVSGDREHLRQIAQALSRRFGDDAAVVVDRQTALAGPHSAVAATWRKVASILRDWMSLPELSLVQQPEAD